MKQSCITKINLMILYQALANILIIRDEFIDKKIGF